ncbi:MAG: hypothetical protein AAGC97_17505 [Planctomycetota bacterium]
MIELFQDAIKILGGALIAAVTAGVIAYFQMKSEREKLSTEHRHRERIDFLNRCRTHITETVEKLNDLSFAESDYRAHLIEWVDEPESRSDERREVLERSAAFFRDSFRKFHEIEGHLYLALQGRVYEETRKYIEHLAVLYRDGELTSEGGFKGEVQWTAEELRAGRGELKELRLGVLALLGEAFRSVDSDSESG